MITLKMRHLKIIFIKAAEHWKQQTNFWCVFIPSSKTLVWEKNIKTIWENNIKLIGIFLQENFWRSKYLQFLYYLQAVNYDPWVGREVVYPGEEEHETSVPVWDQDHHEDQVQDSNGSTRKVEDLNNNVNSSVSKKRGRRFFFLTSKDLGIDRNQDAGSINFHALFAQSEVSLWNKTWCKLNRRAWSRYLLQNLENLAKNLKY